MQTYGETQSILHKEVLRSFVATAKHIHFNEFGPKVIQRCRLYEVIQS